MPFKLGPMELVIILLLVMMIFGVGKLPQVANSIGKALREFRRAQSDEDASPAKVGRGATTSSAGEDGEKA